MRRRTFLRRSSRSRRYPHVSHAQAATTLKFIPVSDLVILDPVWTGARVTRNHGYLVFDTLYGVDETYGVQPQMVAGHTIDSDGRRWTITLRDHLRFHDGEPVRGRDVVASLRRFCVRESFGQSLMATTDELSAPDDRTVVFRLKKPFPHLAQALAGSTGTMPCIMPERLANTDPFKQITEMVGSGPFRFLATHTWLAAAASISGLLITFRAIRDRPVFLPVQRRCISIASSGSPYPIRQPQQQHSRPARSIGGNSHPTTFYPTLPETRSSSFAPARCKPLSASCGSTISIRRSTIHGFVEHCLVPLIRQMQCRRLQGPIGPAGTTG